MDSVSSTIMRRKLIYSSLTRTTFVWSVFSFLLYQRTNNFYANFEFEVNVVPQRRTEQKPNQNEWGRLLKGEVPIAIIFLYQYI